MIEFTMPSLGADMEAGLLVAWHKQPGDVVRRGELMAEVETDKGIIEIEAYSDGVLDSLQAKVGEKVPVGTVLALIREPSQTEKLPASGRSRSADVAARIAISPSARRLARELGVDPAGVSGTGPGGAINRDDIERAATAGSTATESQPPDDQIQAPVSPPLDQSAPAQSARAQSARAQSGGEAGQRMRQAIAAAMARSKREIPHYYLSTTIDMQPAMNWLAEQNLQRPLPERLLYGVLLLKAVALALQEVPELNAVWEAEQLSLKSSIHVGVAISLRKGGLIAPAIHDTDQKSISQLMQEFRDLVSRARGGGLRSSELSDGTITVTSLGEQGVESVFGVIYPPQTAIVGFGRVVERPWSIRGGLMSRQVITATLSADHRVSDGHRGGLFLAAVDRLLQEPERL